jgi:uncharacterized spore protein YtfJ
MKIDGLIQSARDVLGVERVFAAPYENGGVTLIAAATVAGGGGGGGGHDREGQEGGGGGFGVGAKPAGVFTITEGRVRWLPAVDVNRVVGVLGAVTMTYLLTRAVVERARARAAFAER